MSVNFFEKEIDKVQKRFNQTFGSRATCNIKLRQAVILHICSLACLKNTIAKIADNSKAKDEISQFIKIRDALNKIFNTIENYSNERRQLESDRTTPKQRRNYYR